MRTAVCLSGQFRNFKDCYQSLYDNIIQPTNADLFVYGWSFSDKKASGRDKIKGRVYHSHPVLPYVWNTKHKDDPTQRFVENGSEEEFLKLYNPTEYKFEECLAFLKTNKFDFPNKAPETSAERMMCMFYTNFKCFNMIDPTDYDVIFRCRTEITYNRKVSVRDLLSVIEKKLVIPYGLDGRGGYQDSFAFGSPELMSMYSSLYYRIESYAAKGEMVHPEHMLKYHLTTMNVPVKRIDFPMRLRGVPYHD